MLSVGAILIIIALIVGGYEEFAKADLYGASSNKWYFWALIAIVFIIGIILVAWAYMKKETAPAKPAAAPTTT